jgi:hypothetical protein
VVTGALASTSVVVVVGATVDDVVVEVDEVIAEVFARTGFDAVSSRALAPLHPAMVRAITSTANTFFMSSLQSGSLVRVG